MTNDEMLTEFGVNQFNIVIGNPPFNPPKTETGSSGNSIWQNFVMKMHSLLLPGGYLCVVHPPGWKKPTPTEEVYKQETFKNGNYGGLMKRDKLQMFQIRQGRVWEQLKITGTFHYIYTNDQKSKALEYLPNFPAVDYYLYQKGVDKTTCSAKNVFNGWIEESNGVQLNYNLPYLPNLITVQTNDILTRVITKEGQKPSFKVYRHSPSEFYLDSTKGLKYIYTYNSRHIPQYKYSTVRSADDNVNMSKLVLSFDGGIDSYTVQYIKSEDQIGSYHMTMYSKVDSDTSGVSLERFFNSDLVKFVFLITQYASGKMTKNEPLVANSLTIPPEGVADYYEFFGISEHKQYIEDTLAKYAASKAPKPRAPRKTTPRKAAAGAKTKRAAAK